MSDEKTALLLAGAMARAATALVGGMDLSGRVAPATIDNLSAAAERLRIATEAYNAHIFNMTLNDGAQHLPEVLQ